MYWLLFAWELEMYSLNQFSRYTDEMHCRFFSERMTMFNWFLLLTTKDTFPSKYPSFPSILRERILMPSPELILLVTRSITPGPLSTPVIFKFTTDCTLPVVTHSAFCTRYP